MNNKSEGRSTHNTYGSTNYENLFRFFDNLFVHKLRIFYWRKVCTLHKSLFPKINCLIHRRMVLQRDSKLFGKQKWNISNLKTNWKKLLFLNILLRFLTPNLHGSIYKVGADNVITLGKAKFENINRKESLSAWL